MKKNPVLGLLCLSALLPGLASCSPSGYSYVEVDASQGSVGYEIFVGSYRDSNGDGTGDLKGIEQSIPYLKDLGVKRVWLTPIHPSPSYHKYDVVDYYDIDPAFGTLEDFDSLVSSLHEAGIDIIIDLVLNHTSRQNEWFLESALLQGQGYTNGKANWYVWEDRDPGSVGGRTYSYNSTSGKYYECNFSTDMPELNLDNQEVRAEIENIATFWLDTHDIDGFRLDATTYYYMEDSAKSVAYLGEFVEHCRSVKEDAYVVGEAWIDSSGGLIPYSESKASFFVFPTASGANNFRNASFPGMMRSNEGFRNFPSVVSNIQAGFRETSGEDSHTSFFISNHDMTRVDTWFYSEDDMLNRRLMATLAIISPGTPWIYYGEELGMSGEKETYSDRGQRQGMKWGSLEGEEIAPCKNPDSAPDTNAELVGAYDQMNDPTSMYSHYKKAINVRNAHAELFGKGTFKDIAFTMSADDENFVNGFDIELDGRSYLLMYSRDDETRTVEIPSGYTLIEQVNPDFAENSLNGQNLTIQPGSAVLLEENA